MYVDSQGLRSPADITPTSLHAWLTAQPLANNSARAYVTAVRGFLTWCSETSILPLYRDRPYKLLLKSFPPTYGKTQAKFAANRLNADQFRHLLATCRDDTEAGLRDEILVWLGVSGGMRREEILKLTVGTLTREPGRLHWVGKCGKQRSCTVPASLTATIARYLDVYTAAIGRPLRATDPLLVAAAHSHTPVLNWSRPLIHPTSLSHILRKRAAQAGLGHMACHDLKRTAGRMMHEDRGADGGHRFDLLDIADVLDHSNPKVTKDCYIGPLGNDNKDRAANLFD